MPDSRHSEKHVCLGPRRNPTNSETFFVLVPATSEETSEKGSQQFKPRPQLPIAVGSIASEFPPKPRLGDKASSRENLLRPSSRDQRSHKYLGCLLHGGNKGVGLVVETNPKADSILRTEFLRDLRTLPGSSKPGERKQPSDD